MSLLSKLYSNYPFCKDVLGRELRFIKLNGDKLFCAHIKNQFSDKQVSHLEGAYIHIPAQKFRTDELKRLKVWDNFSKEKQDDLLQLEAESKEVVLVDNEEDEPKKVGRKRNSKYAKLPRNIVCKNCGHETYMAPCILIDKADLGDLSEGYKEKLQAFLDEFECSKCSPKRRGRSRNVLYKDIPRKMNCKECGKETVVPAKKVYEETGGDVNKIREYVENYICRSCNPNWGSWLKKKRKKKERSAVC